MPAVSDFESLRLTLPVQGVVALVLGALIGIEREGAMQRRGNRFLGGIRTFPLVSILGFAVTHATGGQPWMPAIGFLGVVALTGISYLGKHGQGIHGATTEVSALVTYVGGMLCGYGELWLAAAIGVTTALLLSEKTKLEALLERLSRIEMLAMLKLAMVSVILLPILPNRSYTSYDLNPFRIWLIVVLVSGFGLLGYFLVRTLGEGRGIWVSGALGGIVSSTAVTVAVARLARNNPRMGSHALRAALTAGSMMYVRLWLLILLLNADLAHTLAPRLLLLSLIGVLLSLSVRSQGAGREERGGRSVLRNPFELRPALLFASFFTVVFVVTRWVGNTYGDAGIVLLGSVAGVHDVNPFVLSLADGSWPSVGVGVASMAVVLATTTNTLMKGVYLAAISRRPLLPVALRFGPWVVAHLIVLLV